MSQLLIISVLVVLTAIGFAINYYTTEIKNSATTEIPEVQRERTEEPKNDIVDEEGSEETIRTEETISDTQPEKKIETSKSNVLDLSNSGLTKTPSSVFLRRDITTLDLSGNNLDGALQAEVRQLEKLEVLDLSDNNFTGVPAEVGQLRALRVLDLRNNPITGLPYEIGNLENLELLDLRGTQYSKQDLEIIKNSLPATTRIEI